MRIIFVAIAGMIACASAFAQDPGAALRSMGLRLAELDQAHWSDSAPARARVLVSDLADIFEATSTGGIRHRRTQKICPPDIGEWRLGRIAMTPPTPSRPESGQDVQCTYLRSAESPEFLSIYIATALFPNAQQSLNYTAAALPQVPGGWRGWFVNMAPPYALDQNVSMTRGSRVVGEGLREVSDIWLTSQLVGDVYWEFKIRSSGSITTRPAFDRLAADLLRDVAGVDLTLDPESAVQAVWGTDAVSWINAQDAEHSGLRHAATGFNCPAPLSDQERATFQVDAGSLACGYDGPSTAFTRVQIGLSRPGVTTRDLLPPPSSPIVWDTLEEAPVIGAGALFGTGVVTAPNGQTAFTMQIAYTNGTAGFVAHVFSRHRENLPSRERFVAFARSVRE